jgi:(S)-2-hydroxyglutarate dehydrogenase
MDKGASKVSKVSENEGFPRFSIIGAGIIGLTVANELQKKWPQSHITIFEKEKDVAFHASGRNSGILHAGFYYSAESLKAQYCRRGNQMMKEFCQQQGLEVRATEKVVVCRNEEELQTLFELKKRGDTNGVPVEIIDEEQLKKLEPNAKTYHKALYSPSTSSVDPKQVCQKLKEILIDRGVQFQFGEQFASPKAEGSYIVNCAGMYADILARKMGVKHTYKILPFKGCYLQVHDKLGFKRNIYPVPNLANPFLGVHFTLTAAGKVKAGPTAIPAFWREQYGFFSRFRLSELLDILLTNIKLFFLNSFNYRRVAWEEIKLMNGNYFKKVANELIHREVHKLESLPSGIRAQLIDDQTGQLVTDFKILHQKEATHVLNIVSPGFTCSFALAEKIVDEIQANRDKNIQPREQI